MPIGDPQDGFFYPTLTLMIDSYKPTLLEHEYRNVDKWPRQMVGFYQH